MEFWQVIFKHCEIQWNVKGTTAQKIYSKIYLFKENWPFFVHELKYQKFKFHIWKKKFPTWFGTIQPAGQWPRAMARISLPFVNCDKTVCHLQSYQRELFFPLKWNSSQTPECDRSFFIESCERDTRRWSSKFLHSEKFSQTYYLCADTFETRSGSFPNSLCQRPGC